MILASPITILPPTVPARSDVLFITSDVDDLTVAMIDLQCHAGAHGTAAGAYTVTLDHLVCQWDE